MSQSSPTPRAPRVPAAEARSRILEAARRLLAERAFAELTIGTVMAEAALPRTVFYRHFDDLPRMAPDLLPDSDAPLIARLEQVEHDDPAALVEAMLDGLVETFAAHGPLLRAIDDAAAHDRAVAEQLELALTAPRALVERLLAGAPHPPPEPAETARMLMATHRAYLLDAFGAGHPAPAHRRRVRAALGDLWDRLLAA